MVAFGLFLLLAVGIVAGFALAAGDDPTVLNLLGFEIDTTDRGMFATGAVCSLGLLIGLRVVAIGLRRARRRRRELRELRSSVGHTATPLSEPEHDRDDHPGQHEQHHYRERRRRERRRSDPDDDWDERAYFESTPHD
jgi:hypothetical protein